MPLPITYLVSLFSSSQGVAFLKLTTMTHEEFKRSRESLNAIIHHASNVIKTTNEELHKLFQSFAHDLNTSDKYSKYLDKKVRIIYQDWGKQESIDGYFTGFVMVARCNEPAAKLSKINKDGKRSLNFYSEYCFPVESHIISIHILD